MLYQCFMYPDLFQSLKETNLKPIVAVFIVGNIQYFFLNGQVEHNISKSHVVCWIAKCLLIQLSSIHMWYFHCR